MAKINTSKKTNYYFEVISDKFIRKRKINGAICCELKKLPDTYLVFQDVKIGENDDIDFIALGPTGIFTIEVKSNDGPIEYNGKELTRWKQPFEKNILNQAMAEALTLHEYLKEKLKKDNFIYPVLVFSNFRTHMSFGLEPVENIFVIQKTWLIRLLTDRPRILSDDEINEIGEIMKCNNIP